MPEVYRGWQTKNKCSFHYLSAMPDQLYTVTKDFIDEEKFPDGTFHMRYDLILLFIILVLLLFFFPDSHFRWASSSIFNFVHSVGQYDITFFVLLNIFIYKFYTK